MKKSLFSVFMILSLLSSQAAFAEPKTVGQAAANSTKTGSNNYWQNWVFAGVAIALATAGLVVLAQNKGKNPTN
jgi:uncharacterized membrane protein YphA (DoxX/SURF4 family)